MRNLAMFVQEGGKPCEVLILIPYQSIEDAAEVRVAAIELDVPLNKVYSERSMLHVKDRLTCPH